MKERSKNCLVLAISSSKIGGAQKVFIQTIIELQKKGFSLIVFLPKGPLVNKLENLKCSIIIINYASFYFYKDLLFTLKRKDILIINTHLPVCSLFFGLINLFFSHKLCVSMHNQIIHEKLSQIKKYLYPNIYWFLSHLVSSFIVNSDFIKNHFIQIAKINPDKIVVIPNGIPRNFYSEIKISNYKKTSKFLITYFGRLSTEKGVEILIRAVNQIKNDEFECLIVGDGPLFSNLNKLVDDLAMKSKVKFLGFCDDIRPYLISSDMVVVPSLNEAFGLVILEAFSFKRLVLASNVGAIPELIIDGKTGYLFDPKNYLQLSELISNVFNNKLDNEVVSHNAFEFFKEQYTSDIISKKMISHFNKRD